MKRILLILFIIFMSVSPISAKTLQGGVEYTEAQIKKMAFDGVKKKLPQKMINANKIDPFFDENKALREKGINETDDRVIDFFADGGYCITYKKDPYTIYYYSPIGCLTVIVVATSANMAIPCKSMVYDENGFLLRLVWIPNDVMVYSFNKDGVLLEYMENSKIFNVE